MHTTQFTSAQLSHMYSPTRADNVRAVSIQYMQGKPVGTITYFLVSDDTVHHYKKMAPDMWQPIDIDSL